MSPPPRLDHRRQAVLSGSGRSSGSGTILLPTPSREEIVKRDTLNVKEFTNNDSRITFPSPVATVGFASHDSGGSAPDLHGIPFSIPT